MVQSNARLLWLWRAGGLDARADGEESGGGSSGTEDDDGSGTDEEGAAAAGGSGSGEAAGGTAAAAAGGGGGDGKSWAEDARRRIARGPDPSGGSLELAP